MKRTFLLFITIFLISFTNDNGLVKEEFVYHKRRFGCGKKLTLLIPNYESETKRRKVFMFGGHGVSFQIHYTDSAVIYYNNDWATGSLNEENYKTIGWKKYPRITMGPDTVLFGQQQNGLYWKEIKKNDEFIGYLNVAKEHLEKFDKSILTLKKRFPNPIKHL